VLQELKTPHNICPQNWRLLTQCKCWTRFLYLNNIWPLSWLYIK